MKTIVLYYSYGGASKKEAEHIASEEDVTLCQVKELRRRSFLGTFVPGCLQAIKRKAPKIQPLGYNLAAYDRIVVGCSVWAGYPAPAFNSAINLLPAGKKIDLFLCSCTGDTSKSAQGTKDLIAAKNCTLTSYRDIKTDAVPKRRKGE